MAEYTFGTAGYIKFGSTVLSADARNFEPEEEIGLVDASAGNDASRTYLATLLDGKATLELVAQTGGTALWTALKPGTSGTLEWGEEGTTAGKPKHSVVAKVQRRRRALPYEGVAMINADLQFSDTVGVVDGTY